MTKEEVEKEAEDSWQNDSTVSGASMPNKIYVAGYLAGTEPKEKRIVELESQIEEMKCCGNCEFKDCDKSNRYQTCWYCKNKDKWKLRR